MTTATQQSSEQADKTAIRPFHVNVPEAELTELRRRIKATRWPDKETAPDATQGVQLAAVQAIAAYWGSEYDWRKVETRLNALPQFVTEIDGLDIHFIHVRSKHDNALPLIVTHGWPGSIIEQMKIIDPLTNPTAHGGSASDAFHLVIPSIPGYGYSGKPTAPGWDAPRIARAWGVLMKRLGYTKYVAQGGDWGAVITEQMGVQAAPELLGIHTNMPGAIPNDIHAAAFAGAPAPAGLSAEEKACYDELLFVFSKGIGYAFQMGLRPQTLYGIADSPVGLAGYGTSARFYYEAAHNPWTPVHDRVPVVEAPVAISVLPEEICSAPRRWAQRYYNLQQKRQHASGGHFAAWEEPQAIITDVRDFFRTLI